MCRCTPEIRTPFCGKPGCEWPTPDQIFYELMQNYRNALIEDQGAVSKAFNAVRDFITGQVEAARSDGLQRGQELAQKAIRDAFENGKTAAEVERRKG